MSFDDKLSAAASHADSPFLPAPASAGKVQFAWDSVSLTSFLSCPRRYQLSILQGYVPRNPAVATALVFGILIHSALEQYHRARAAEASHDEALHKALAMALASPAAETLPTDEALAEEPADADDDGISTRTAKTRTRYYLARTIVWYLEHYKNDALQTLVLPSGQPAVETSFRIPIGIEVGGGSGSGGNATEMLLCGHIDRVVLLNDQAYVVDYKTTKSLSRQFFEMFDLSHQMTGYTLAGKVIFQREVKGAWIDGIALLQGSIKLARHLTNRTAGQLTEYRQLLQHVAQQATLFASRYAEQDYPMNTASCYFCDYKTCCRQPPEFRQRYIDQAFERKPGWNPLQNR
jgi:RecB family exonuclease